MMYRKNSVSIFSTILVLIVLSLCSCTRYQYVAIDSNLPRNQQNEYLVENDSMRITYNFQGWEGPLNINIENKGDKPFYINWQKSAVILDGKKYSLWQDRTDIQGIGSDITLRWNNFYSSGVSDFQGVLYRDEQVSFIPPHSSINMTPVNLRTNFIPRSNEVPVARTSLPTREGRVNAKLQLFEPDNSPVKFRSFLTLSSDQNFNNPVYLDDLFWISSVTESHSSPGKVTYLPENQYYLRQTTGFGSFTIGVVAITTIVLAVIFGANNSGG
jgi:hypothetical protein